MKDKVLVYAIGASVLVHLVAAGIIGHSSGLGVATASVVQTPRTISVDLAADPNDAFKPQPKLMQDIISRAPIPQNNTVYTRSMDNRPVQTAYSPNTGVPRPVRIVAGAKPISSSTPGGRLNYGSASSNGDLGGDWNNGRTPTGWVPGAEHGEGKGYGSAAGESAPEPPKPVVEPQVVKPTPPPAPKVVYVKVCDESGLLPGEYCKRTHTGTFIEGEQPTRKCNQCKAPEPVHQSRLADRANPELLRDVRPSVEEDMFGTVGVEYTVTVDGDVTGVKVTRSSGNRALDKAVMRAVSGLKYKPAVQDGTPRSVKMTREYELK